MEEGLAAPVPGAPSSPQQQTDRESAPHKARDAEADSPEAEDSPDKRLKELRAKVFASPLCAAADEGDVDKVRQIFRSSRHRDASKKFIAELNEPDSKAGVTPLVAACAEGHAEVARLLLEAGAAVDGFDRGGSLPIVEAAFCEKEGALETLKVLISHGAAVNLRENSPTEYCAITAACNHIDADVMVDMVRELIKAGANVNARNTIVEDDEDENDDDSSRCSEDEDESPPDSKAQTPLHFACEAGTVELVRVLLEAGADPNLVAGTHGFAPLHFAVQWCCRRRAPSEDDVGKALQVAELLLAAGADVDRAARPEAGRERDAWEASPQTALHLAAEAGAPRLVRALLHAGADPNLAAAMEGMFGGATALHFAVRRVYETEPEEAARGTAEVARLLLGAGADLEQVCWERGYPDAGGPDIVTPLVEAMLAGADIHVVQTLIDAGADVNYLCAEDSRGSSALLTAARDGLPEHLRALLAAGAAVDSEGVVDSSATVRTALGAAAEAGHGDLVRRLVEAGADVHRVPPDPLEGKDRGRGHPGAKAGVEGKPGDEENLPETGKTKKRKVEDAQEPACSPVSREKGGAAQAALYLAAQHCDVQTVQVLIDAGAAVDQLNPEPGADECWSALMVATNMGRLDVVEALCAAGAEVDKACGPGVGKASATPGAPTTIGLSALHLAALGEGESHLEVLRHLIGRGAAANPPPSSEYGTPLLCAASCGNLAAVEELLRAGADAAAGEGLDTPLIGAACNGRLEVMRALLRAGVDAHSQAPPDGPTALWQAAWKGQAGAVRLLLEPQHRAAGAGDPTAVLVRVGPEWCGSDQSALSTPLVAAARSGSAPTVQALLDHGAAVDAAEVGTGMTPLLYAALSGHLAVLQALLAAGANPNINSDKAGTPLIAAAIAGHTPCIQALLESQTPVDLEARLRPQALSQGEGAQAGELGCTALLAACRNGEAAAATALIRAGADMEATLLTPREQTGVDLRGAQSCLMVAMSRGHPECVRALIRGGVNTDSSRSLDDCVNKEGDPSDRDGPLSSALSRIPALYTAILLKDATSLRVLLEEGAGDPSDGLGTSAMPALFCAIKTSCVEVMELLLAKGADPDGENSSGQTALSLAASEGCEAIVRALLDAGAQIDRVCSIDARGYTPLMDAAHQGCEGAVRLLLERGADLEATSTYGRTALLSAAAAGHAGVVKLLLHAGANKDHTAQGDGLSPLRIAVYENHAEVVKLLLEAGADVSRSAPEWHSILKDGVKMRESQMSKQVARLLRPHVQREADRAEEAARRQKLGHLRTRKASAAGPAHPPAAAGVAGGSRDKGRVSAAEAAERAAAELLAMCEAEGAQKSKQESAKEVKKRRDAEKAAAKRLEREAEEREQREAKRRAEEAAREEQRRREAALAQRAAEARRERLAAEARERLQEQREHFAAPKEKPGKQARSGAGAAPHAPAAEGPPEVAAAEGTAGPHCTSLSAKTTREAALENVLLSGIEALMSTDSAGGYGGGSGGTAAADLCVDEREVMRRKMAVRREEEAAALVVQQRATEQEAAAQRSAEQRAMEERVAAQRNAEQRLMEHRAAARRAAEARAMAQQEAARRDAEQRAVEHRAAAQRDPREQREDHWRVRVGGDEGVAAPVHGSGAAEEAAAAGAVDEADILQLLLPGAFLSPAPPLLHPAHDRPRAEQPLKANAGPALGMLLPPPPPPPALWSEAPMRRSAAATTVRHPPPPAAEMGISAAGAPQWGLPAERPLKMSTAAHGFASPSADARIHITEGSPCIPLAPLPALWSGTAGPAGETPLRFQTPASEMPLRFQRPVGEIPIRYQVPEADK